MVFEYYHTLLPEQAHLSLSSFAIKNTDLTEHLSIKQANLQKYLLPMYLSEFHVQEGKQLSWIPFLLYFTHGSYDLIGEGGLSQLAYVNILSLSFPRTTSI